MAFRFAVFDPGARLAALAASVHMQVIAEITPTATVGGPVRPVLSVQVVAPL